MEIIAPVSRYKKNNLLIMAGILAVAAGWFYYDGYHSPEFAKKHTNPDGSFDSTMNFNRKSPPYMLIAAAFFAVRFWLIKDKKIVAGQQGLQAGAVSIPYDAIDSIDKTHFDKKGFFVISYTQNGTPAKLTLSDRSYDNMPAVLDRLTAKLK